MSDFSPSSTVQQGEADLTTATEFLSKGDGEATDAAAIDDYRHATRAAESAAMVAKSAVDVLANDPRSAPFSAAIASLVDSASTSVTDGDKATTKTDAHRAAEAGILAATHALALARQAIAETPEPPRVTIGTVGAMVAAVVIGGGLLWLFLAPPSLPPIPAPTRAQRRYPTYAR